MTEAYLPLIIGGVAVLVTAMLCAAALSAWRGWLKLKHAELRGPALRGDPSRSLPAAEEQGAPAVLIEVAAVKERLRRLEAIANGVEL
jgi:hypothetical protein